MKMMRVKQVKGGNSAQHNALFRKGVQEVFVNSN